MRNSTRILITVFTILLSLLGVFTLIAAQDGKKTETTEKNTLIHTGYGSGNSAVSDNNARKTPLSFRITKIFPLRNGIEYAVSEQKGFLISFDRGATWEARNNGLPRRETYPPDNLPVRHFTSIGIDPVDQKRAAVTTRSGIYLTENYGISWEQIPLGKPLRKSSYLTSVALSPDNRDTILLGTSFNGFFETDNRGKTWTDPSVNLRFLYKGSGFYEEISAVTYIPGDADKIFFACRFTGILYSFNKKTGKISGITLPGNRILTGMKIIKAASGHEQNTKDTWILKVYFFNSSLYYSLSQKKWITLKNTPIRTAVTLQTKTALDSPGSGRNAAADSAASILKDERKRLAADKYGIYISAHRASGKYFDDHIAFIKKYGLNSFVIDCKDDYGWLTYNSNLKLPGEIHAVKRWFNLDSLLKKAHANGLYVIARIVVFKDQQLFNYDNYKYALWNSKVSEPWRYKKQYKDKESDETKWFQREYWVDPYSEFVWRYNINIARELQARGVDEIQFDYIRFPSDGNLSEIRYRYKKEGMSKIDALESFLKMAREAINIPISTDIYGFNAWYRMGNWIGQSIEMISKYADVISPMFYPSHFPSDFLKDEEYIKRAEIIYNEGTRRAKIIINNAALIRPFIQAFLIGKELEMSRDEYTHYLTSQINGALSAAASGFTLWNASNRYYMVTEPLQPIINRERKK